MKRIALCASLILAVTLLTGATIRSIPPGRTGPIVVRSAGVASTGTWSRVDLVLELLATNYNNPGNGQSAWLLDSSDRARHAVMTLDTHKPSVTTDAGGGTVLGLSAATYIHAATDTDNLLTGTSFTLAFSGKVDGTSGQNSAVLTSYNSLAPRMDIFRYQALTDWSLAAFPATSIIYRPVTPGSIDSDAVWLMEVDENTKLLKVYQNGDLIQTTTAGGSTATFVDSMKCREYALFCYGGSAGLGMVSGSYFRWLRVWRRVLSPIEKLALNNP